MNFNDLDYKINFDINVDFENDISIGVVGLYDIYSDTIWLSWFGVLENYKSKGYGSQFLRI